jgi:hypothetical protein
MIAVGPGSQMTTGAGARTIMAAGPTLKIRAGAGRRAPFGRRRGSRGDAEPARIVVASAGRPFRPKPAVRSMSVSVTGWIIPAASVRMPTRL